MRPIRLELSAVIFALGESDGRLEPLAATTRDEAGAPDLPTTVFDPDAHRTLELALRDWVARSTGVTLGYVEQLYTFGDRARGAPDAAPDSPHVVSIGYLALARPQAAAGPRLGWTPWRAFFPWEDRRAGGAGLVEELAAPALAPWLAAAPERKAEWARRCFGLDGRPWRDELALERLELLYGAGLTEEAWRDRGETPPPGLPRLGAPMPRDHRRILATAIGRLRGKLKYRPVLFELTPPTFTLLELQQAAEAVSGVALHKQNFRRQVAASGLVEPTGATSSRHGGRPAAEYRFAVEADRERRARARASRPAER